MNAPTLPDHLHQLVLLYMALVYGEDHDLDPHERQTVITLLRRWMPEVDEAAAAAVVDTARTATRSGSAIDVEALARDLRPRLSLALRRRVVSDLGKLARSDGHLSLKEAALIRRIRAVWHGPAARSRGPGNATE